MWSSVECVRCRVFAALTMPGNYMFGLWPLPCPATICLVCGPYHARQLYVTVWWSYLYVGYMFALQYAYYNICMYNYVCIYIYINVHHCRLGKGLYVVRTCVSIYIHTAPCMYLQYIYIYIYIQVAVYIYYSMYVQCGPPQL